MTIYAKIPPGFLPTKRNLLRIIQQAQAVPASPRRCTIKGSKIYDPNGNEIFFAGVNQGTWGETRDYDSTWIKGQGGNVVRRLLRWWGLYGSPDTESRVDSAPGHIDPAHLQKFIAEIQSDRAAGLWTVVAIDSNGGQDGTQTSLGSCYDYCMNANAWPFDPAYPPSTFNSTDGRNFFTDPSQKQKFKEAWLYLVSILKDYDNILFYEILPEPLNGRSASWAPAVQSFYVEFMDAIKAVDPRALFLIGPRDAYNPLRIDEAYIPGRNDYALTGDIFIKTANDQATNLSKQDAKIAALTSCRATRNVPVFVQQFGIRTGDDTADNFYLKYGINQMQVNALPGTWWQLRQNTSALTEYALIVQNPPGSGVDIFKTDQIYLVRGWWQTMATKTS